MRLDYENEVAAVPKHLDERICDRLKKNMPMTMEVSETFGWASTLSPCHFDLTSRSLQTLRNGMNTGMMRTGKAKLQTVNPFHYRASMCLERLLKPCSGQAIGNWMQHVLIKKVLQDLGWRMRCETITLSATGTIHINCMPPRTPVFTFRTREIFEVTNYCTPSAIK